MTERITSLEEIKDPEKFLNAYYGAMEDAKTLREEKKALEDQIAASANADSDEEVQKWKKMALEAKASSALGSESKRLLKYIDLGGVEMEEDGTLKGMDEKIEGLKKDFPELFDTKRKAGRNSADIHDNNAPKVERSSTDMQLDALFK